MKEIKGEYWIIDDNKVKLQIKTKQEQVILEEMLPEWRCVSHGFIPKTMEDIYVFEKAFERNKSLTERIISDTINKQITIREVTE